jgi:hypothetical protein
LFDVRGEMRWSSETTTGPDLINLVDDALSSANSNNQAAGQVRMLDEAPVYLFWLRNDTDQLVAILTIVCRANGNAEADTRNFSLVQSLLRPALECLRRDLLARAVITDLNRTVTALDKDLELSPIPRLGLPPVMAPMSSKGCCNRPSNTCVAQWRH